VSATRPLPGEPGERLPALVHDLILELGENPLREGLAGTPARVAESLRFLTDGYGIDVAEVVEDAIFAHDTDEMVLVRDLPFFSLCEHHFLPFFGSCHVAYVPDGRVVGLSKIPRVIDVYAHRLQIQENLTNQIAESLSSVLRPRGVAVVIEARHLCMEMRGVERVGGSTVTSCMLGVFRRDARTRSEFLDLIGRRSGAH
jgi:GTP cyclohydrolase I